MTVAEFIKHLQGLPHQGAEMAVYNNNDRDPQFHRILGTFYLNEDAQPPVRVIYVIDDDGSDTAICQTEDGVYDPDLRVDEDGTLVEPGESR